MVAGRIALDRDQHHPSIGKLWSFVAITILEVDIAGELLVERLDPRTTKPEVEAADDPQVYPEMLFNYAWRALHRTCIYRRLSTFASGHAAPRNKYY